MTALEQQNKELAAQFEEIKRWREHLTVVRDREALELKEQLCTFRSLPFVSLCPQATGAQ